MKSEATHVTEEDLAKLKLFQSRAENIALHGQILESERSAFHAGLAKRYDERPGEALSVDLATGAITRRIVDAAAFAGAAAHLASIPRIHPKKKRR